MPQQHPPITAHPVGVNVPSSVDLMNTGSYGSSQLIAPGGFGRGLQVLADLMPLTSYSFTAQFLSIIPIDHFAHLS